MWATMTNSLCAVNEHPIARPFMVRQMQEPFHRLKKARAEAGFSGPTDAARAMGVPPPTYLGHENGTTGLRRDAAIRYAAFFRVSLDWLLTGKGGTRRKPLAPVVGEVGAGAEVFPFDDFPQGGGIEMVDAPPGEDGCVAVKIKGDSQYPLQEGWLIFYRRLDSGVDERNCLGKLCVVKINDGATMLKTLRRGTSKHHYRLESWNAPPREDVVLEWASPVLDIRPR